MITALPIGNKWVARYVGGTGHWRFAYNALGQPLFCDTRELALSVAKYRRRRLRIWK